MAKDTSKDSVAGTGRFPHKEMSDEEKEQREYAVNFAKETRDEEIEAGKQALDSLVDQDERQTEVVEEAQKRDEKLKNDPKSGVASVPGRDAPSKKTE